MKPDYLRFLIFFLIILPVTWVLSCSGRPGKKAGSDLDTVSLADDAVAAKLIRLVLPEENTGFKLKDPVRVVIEPDDRNRQPDSVMIFFDGKPAKILKAAPWEYSIPPAFTITTGRKSLKVSAFKNGKPQNTITRFMIVYSDVVPKRNGYKVVHAYPHDREAFTQGLVYDKGKLYEGTGQESGSTLREVDLVTGKVLRQHNLDASLFGEGIALYDDRIYQVSWQNKVGFVYDKSSFKMINKIYYPMQGWGLTTIDDKLVMSEGTNVLYYFEPEMFTVVSRLEVYDNEKKVDSLNELEYINGEIWANIWMNDNIARIDPSTGKVIAYVDLKGLLPDTERKSDTDVLNGIAYDPDGKRIFVTGKRWPRLYEIKIIE
jgi:glutamine cyclotransferase